MRDFDEWLSKFRASISSYDYYIDFEKVVKNVEEIKVELNILNTLIGSKNIEEDFEKIMTKYPETLQCIPLLLAVRGYEIYAQDEDGAFLYNFKKMNYSVEQYKIFMRKTGLFDMIANHLVNNLVDYALGIETGLDSNGRKNRGGHQMEDLVEKYIVAAGFKKDVNYFKEMYLRDIEEKWDIDLSALSNQGKAAKRFDFVIKTDKMIYVIETNFYGGGGSKLNETARSYKMLSQEADTIDGFTFVWFTDGIGWKSARGNLRETFEVLDTIYSIDDMENGIMLELFCDRRDGHMKYYYDVVLSFAGEDREYVEECADILTALGIKVFYDSYEQDVLWGKDLYTFLADIYSNKARYAIVFISQHYVKKCWTKHEFKFINERMFNSETEYLLPVFLDDTKLCGIPETQGYLTNKTPYEVAVMFAKR